MKNVLITGYRAHELNIFSQKHKGIKYIQQAIVGKLRPLVEEGLEWVITPGQYGVDLWACEAVIELKRQYPGLKLSIITAYANPEEGWKEDKKTYYQSLVPGVDYCASISKGPYEGAWQFTARDELLLRKTDGIILVYDEDAGEGSPRYMKEKAMKKAHADGYQYISITSDDIQSIADEAGYREIDETFQEE
ncbi:DUF1273 domain-containing protein [Paenibacillus paeoniae]|uniref:DUF1273 domain-containing protein n=1 Tax=Paenibacillus paeoniae TaxID=2292705 RepID=A0A371PP12_9BACL|nr:DUF1273 domain-containing protein [Paenibacillus paeoniae]REK77527.1 DUF1273 domain-containing protein [Paenibacillus paeoniae]